jgi:ferrous iron transport protein A
MARGKERAAATMTTTTTINLSAVRQGESVRVRGIEGGHTFLSRLASLGFTPGVLLRVVQNVGRGPLIVNLRDTRVALGRGEASKIVVQRLQAGDHEP